MKENPEAIINSYTGHFHPRFSEANDPIVGDKMGPQTAAIAQTLREEHRVRFGRIDKREAKETYPSA